MSEIALRKKKESFQYPPGPTKVRLTNYFEYTNRANWVSSAEWKMCVWGSIAALIIQANRRLLSKVVDVVAPTLVAYNADPAAIRPNQ